MIKWLKRLFAKEKPIELPTKPIYKPLELTLERIHQFDDCTIGILSCEGSIQCYILELPYKDNKNYISSIPVGRYKCIHFDGVQYKDVWQLLDVPNRSAILIHWGNWATNTRGCLIAGSNFGKLKGKNAVLNSKVALNSLKKFIGRDEEGKLNSFYLRIK
jgi:hypothetical protein